MFANEIIPILIRLIRVIFIRWPDWILILAAIILMQLTLPSPSEATQGHGGIEGVYAHQIAHLFFLFSMGYLIYWLRARGLIRQSGWRMIQYSAIFFILWNLNTVFVHALDDQFNIIQIQRIDTWHIRLTDPFSHNLLKTIYYLAKLDHLLCVPALICLYVGLKRLLKDTQAISSGDIPS